MTELTVIEHETPIVVGSGIAGLSVALGLDGCTIISRYPFGRGSSDLAQGGIAAGRGADADAHRADTLAVSGSLGDPTVAGIITAAAADRIEWLIGLGAEFDRDERGNLLLGREAGHSARRIVHAAGDATGPDVMRALRDAVALRPDIDITEAALIDLVRCGDTIAGGVVIDALGNHVVHLAPAVVLATGGIGGIYARTTNPPGVAGDGIAVAARAGVEMADLEFVQFHPTALDVDADPAPLLTEALRGEGVMLVNDRGERFMRRVHPAAELAPRDIVARAIWDERARGRRTFLDATGSIGSSFPERFPTVWEHARAAGFDPRFEPLPVAPAEHYHMGGIATGAAGRSSTPGLWAVGEVASTGFHGANRLASNSLLEGMVVGAAAAKGILSSDAEFPRGTPTIPDRALGHGTETGGIADVRSMMWDHVGLVRDEVSLRDAVDRLNSIGRSARTNAAKNIALVGSLIARAALARTESRGAHYRSDYPSQDPAWSRRSFIRPEPAPSVPIRSRAMSAA